MTPITPIHILKKSDTKNNRWLIIFAVLAALIAAFIFSNSLQPPDESNSRSMALARWLYGFPLFRNWMAEDAFHRFIRKLAHFTEFGALGLSLGGAAHELSVIKDKKYIIFLIIVKDTLIVNLILKVQIREMKYLSTQNH